MMVQREAIDRLTVYICVNHFITAVRFYIKAPVNAKHSENFVCTCQNFVENASDRVAGWCVHSSPRTHRSTIARKQQQQHNNHDHLFLETRDEWRERMRRKRNETHERSNKCTHRPEKRVYVYNTYCI